MDIRKKELIENEQFQHEPIERSGTETSSEGKHSDFPAEEFGQRTESEDWQLNENREGPFGKDLALGGRIRISRLLNASVRDLNGEDVGTVVDLIADEERLKWLVLSLGGFLGIGKRYVAVPIKAISPEDNFIRVNIFKHVLEKAPEIDLDKFPDIALPEWEEQTFTHFASPTIGRDEQHPH